jgi:hypothetical protein
MSSIRFGPTPIGHTGLDIDLDSLSDEFSKILNRFKLSVPYFHAYTDAMTGDVFVNIADNDGHSIDAIFTVDEDGIPGCSILDKNDKEISWIDLEGIAPVIQNKIDFGMGKWFRYSILSNLLKLGNIEFTKLGESKANQVITTLNKIEEAFSFRGVSKMAVVSHRSRRKPLTTRQSIGLESARRMSKKGIEGLAENDVEDDGSNILAKHLSKFLYQKIK